MVKYYLFIFLVLISGSAGAETATVPSPVTPPVSAAHPFNTATHYDFTWNGIPLGKVLLEAKEDAATYHMHVVIKSKGLVSSFAKHKSDTLLDGTRVGESYFPTLYETNYQTRNKPKHIRIDSDGAGHIVKELSEPADGPDRPKVKAESKATASDPLTTVFLIRAAVKKAVANNSKSFDLNMFDGRRLSKLHVDVLGKEEGLINGKKREAIHLVASRTPAEGFTDKELERMKTDPKMNIFFSADDAMMPLLMEVSWYGTLRGVINGQ